MLNDFKRDGVCVVKNVVENVNDLRAFATMCLQGSSEEAPYKSGRRLQKRGKFPALLFWPALQSACIDEIRLSVANIVQEFLGDDVKQLNNQLYFRLPGDGDAFAWHQDVMFRKGFVGGPYDYIQTAICIDPMTEENGGIGFVLGSHECDDLKLVDKADVRKPTGPPTIFENFESENPMPVKYFDCKPGDMLVWSHMTVHGSDTNDSDRPRMTLMNGFGKAECCDGWPYYIRSGRVVENVDVDSIPYN